MMSRDGVTIVIPNWNHELLLPRSIHSALEALDALQQESCPGEVLVIDDQSRDGSLPLLRQLEALHHAQGLRILALGRNGGLAAARNLGLTHARFRYLVFLDADDELEPQNMPTFWRTLRDTGAAAAYGNLLRRLLSSPTPYSAFSNESFRDFMLLANYITAIAMFDRDQLIDAGGYHTAFTTHEDYEQWLHLACNGRRIVFVPVVFGYYDTLPESMITDQATGSQNHRRILRMYDQTRGRKYMPINTRHLRYHPAVGYL